MEGKTQHNIDAFTTSNSIHDLQQKLTITLDTHSTELDASLLTSPATAPSSSTFTSSTSPKQQSKKIKLHHSLPSSSYASSTEITSNTNATTTSQLSQKNRNSSLSSLNTLMDACPLDDVDSSSPSPNLEFTHEITQPHWLVSEFYQGSDPVVMTFVNAMLEGLTPIQARFHNSPIDPNDDKEWIYELATECDLNVFPLLLTLEPSISDPNQLVSFLLATEALLQHHFPHPDLLCSLLLPQFRSIFALPVFAKALLLHPSTHGNSEALLSQWLVGRLNKMSDMQLMGELAAMCYTLALDTTPPWPLHWANDDGLCIYFKALATQAAGWHPFCYASLTRGFASLFHQDVHVLATFFVACYPTLSSYEKDHGDLGWMLLQWCQLEESAGLSPLMMDVALFFKDLCTHWLSSFHPTKDPETLLGLKLIHVYVFPTRPWDFFFNHELSDSSLNDSETSPFSPLLFNAVRQGACPYHVRLAIQSVPEPSLVTYFITLFKFAYEVPFLSLIQFQLSWRLSDWKLILPPDSAFQACFQFFLNHPSHTALMHPDFPDLGFLEPNAFDLVEQPSYKRLVLDNDEDDHTHDVEKRDGLDTFQPFSSPSLLPFFEDKPCEDFDTAVDVDTEPDQAFIELCIQHVEKANGDINQIDVDALVDVLMAEKQVS